jgi:hypothetical protein
MAAGKYETERDAAGVPVQGAGSPVAGSKCERDEPAEEQSKRARSDPDAAAAAVELPEHGMHPLPWGEGGREVHSYVADALQNDDLTAKLRAVRAIAEARFWSRDIDEAVIEIFARIADELLRMLTLPQTTDLNRQMIEEATNTLRELSFVDAERMGAAISARRDLVDAVIAAFKDSFDGWTQDYAAEVLAALPYINGYVRARLWEPDCLGALQELFAEIDADDFGPQFSQHPCIGLACSMCATCSDAATLRLLMDDDVIASKLVFAGKHEHGGEDKPPVASVFSSVAAVDAGILRGHKLRAPIQELLGDLVGIADCAEDASAALATLVAAE